MTPTWVKFRVRAAAGRDRPQAPLTGIGSFCLDPQGAVLVSNGTVWEETGKTYTAGRWYDVIMKLNFTTKSFDFFFYDVLNPDPQLTPTKTSLAFADPSVNTLSNLKFSGAYNAEGNSDVFLDDIAVTFFDRLEFISPAQKLFKDQVSSPIVIQLQNGNAASQTAIADMTLELRSSSATGKFSLSPDPWSPIDQLIVAEGAQGVVVYYKDSTAGEHVLSVNEYPEQGLNDGLHGVEVVNQVASFKIEAITPQVAGTLFNVRITALDEDGNINTDYSEDVTLTANYVTPNQGTLAFSPPTASGFLNGVLDLNGSYPDAGIITITVADPDELNKSGTSPQITFLPASFTVSADSVQTVGKSFTLNVTALSASGNPLPNYQGVVALSVIPVAPVSLPGAALTPAVVASTDFSNGLAKPSIAFNLAGSIKILAVDSANPTKKGESGVISFYPKALEASISTPPNGRNYFYTGESITLTIKLLDEKGVEINNYVGTVDFSGSITLGLPPSYSFETKDGGKKVFSLSPSQAGVYSVRASADSGSLTDETPQFTVRQAIIQVVDTVSPLGTGEVEIQLVDENGNIIDDSNMEIGVDLQEEVGDGSASLNNNRVGFKNGRAKISVSNSEAEIVTINPKSSLKLKTRKGTITFGKSGKSGINPLFWREIKKKK